LNPNDIDTVIDLVSVNGVTPDVSSETQVEDSDSVILYTKMGIVKARTLGQNIISSRFEKTTLFLPLDQPVRGRPILRLQWQLPLLKIVMLLVLSLHALRWKQEKAWVFAR